ncbi:response regulator [Micromonospora aurantiaca (nom. illeg.)]|uniref:response regulator n=1 Tax=Micromonospora aurantiaca (nom. illeg.) TaxID=47850 RepID=UPI0033D42E50
MIRQLADVHVLVADDQPDVARTLCRPVERAGARLHFVDNGTAALTAATGRPFDLIIVDLKMPPDDWGGLWLLERLQAEGLRTPALVLSGEGSKQQTIRAMRLGAADWVDKDDASTELLDRCAEVHIKWQAQALEEAIGGLPAPLAAHFARYWRATDVDRQVNVGLAALEAVLRFAAMVGLATTPPAPLSGVTAAQLARPSMGTWLTVCTRLLNLAGAGSEFTRLLACLIPRGGAQPVQDLVNLRNGIAHGRTTSTAAHADHLDGLLRRFAARAAAFWRADIGVATTMTYDGMLFHAEFDRLRGTRGPFARTVATTDPTITGQVFLLPHAGAPVTLSPWLVAERAPSSGAYHCFQFDGSDTRPSTESPLRYANAGDPSGPPPPPSTATWREAEPWVQ